MSDKTFRIFVWMSIVVLNLMCLFARELMAFYGTVPTVVMIIISIITGSVAINMLN